MKGILFFLKGGKFTQKTTQQKQSSLHPKCRQQAYPPTQVFVIYATEVHT